MTPDLLLFADCETTGIPDFAAPAEDPKQPRIASMAGILVERQSRKVLTSWHLWVRPDGWEMPKELSDKMQNGLTQEALLKYGVPIDLVLNLLLHAADRGAVPVFHNAHFDAKMLRIEFRREFPEHPYANFDIAGGGLPTICTYKSTPDECRRARGDKKLGTVYTWLTGKAPPANAHSAMADACMVRDVFFGLEDKGVEFK